MSDQGTCPPPHSISLWTKVLAAFMESSGITIRIELFSTRPQHFLGLFVCLVRIGFERTHVVIRPISHFCFCAFRKGPMRKYTCSAILKARRAFVIIQRYDNILK
jgi:hypothetical protein